MSRTFLKLYIKWMWFLAWILVIDALPLYLWSIPCPGKSTPVCPNLGLPMCFCSSWRVRHQKSTRQEEQGKSCNRDALCSLTSVPFPLAGLKSCNLYLFLHVVIYMQNPVSWVNGRRRRCLRNVLPACFMEGTKTTLQIPLFKCVNNGGVLFTFCIWHTKHVPV